MRTKNLILSLLVAAGAALAPVASQADPRVSNRNYLAGASYLTLETVF